MICFNSAIARTLIVGVLVAQAGTVHGSVVLSNTRVIYNANAPEQTLQFSNRDDGPSVMQVWIDSGDEKSTPKTADAPFLLTPPIFRIESKGGQMVRIVFTGKDLPPDRETVFYLNTLQVPSVSAAYGDQNQMLLMLRNRLKLFYRPVGLDGSAQSAPGKLSFHISGQGKAERISATNPSPYYVSLLNGSVACGSQTATFDPDMIAPRSAGDWTLKGGCPLDESAIRVKLQYIDDFGAIRNAEYPVAVQRVK